MTAVSIYETPLVRDPSHLELLTQAPEAPAWRMRQMPCGGCGADAYDELFASRVDGLENRDVQELFACTSSAYGECGPIVRCRACGLIYQNPQPDPESVLIAYENVVDVKYAEERQGRVHTFRRALVEMERHLSGGRLLDVGSHLGVFVEVARERGWAAEGVELSRWAVEIAHGRGLPVTQGTVDDLEVEEGSYDAITMWDVIEHLSDPLGELRKLHRLLRSGGLIAISTMDVDAPIARILGRRWPWYMLMHLVYFSKSTLRRMVEAAGYEVVEVRRHHRIVRLSYLVGQLKSRLGPFHGPLAWFVERTNLGRRLVTVDLGDIVTLFARKPETDDRSPWGVVPTP